MQLQLQKSQLASAGRVCRPGRRALSVRAIAEPPAKLAEPGQQTSWKPQSWQSRTAHQQPNYPDRAELMKACDEIRSYPPLIFAGECRNLQERLAKAAIGEAFILQGGDCAEAFTQFSANRIRDTYRVLLQMSVVMMFGGGVPVIKLGRMAGQFAKPRCVQAGYGQEHGRRGARLPQQQQQYARGVEVRDHPSLACVI